MREVTTEVLYDMLAERKLFFATECNPDEFLHFIKQDLLTTFEYHIESSKWDEQSNARWKFKGNVMGILFDGIYSEQEIMNTINPRIEDVFGKKIFMIVIGSTFHAYLIDPEQYKILTANKTLKSWSS